jgi:VCBS repeat-containing protein
MRQSDGSEILGPNDPRNLVIGIIHVTLNDDRQSVITAITTQEKFGRDQIVLDLPAQNKAFKTVIDFEGLHKMASEIEATIVLVAPAKSRIANFARKENFTVYPSLDELVAAEFPPMQPDEPDEEPAITATSPAKPVPVPEDDEGDHTIMFPIELPGSPPPETSSAPPETPQPQPVPVIPEEAPTASFQVPVSEAETPTTGLPAGENAPLVEDEEPTIPRMPVADAQAQPTFIDATGTPSMPQTPAPERYLPVPVASAANSLAPANALPFYYAEPDPRRRLSWKTVLITAVIVIILIGMGILFYRPILDLIFPPTAAVTITPDSQLLKQTYQFTAVLGVPDPTRDQVDARALYATSQTQSQTVKATGQGHTSGEQAHGVLTFYNVSTSPQTIPADTVFIDNHDIAVANDQSVTLPAFDPTQSASPVTVSAHSINAGTLQNIPAYDFDHTAAACCAGSVYISNTSSFTGGQDAQTYTYVQQSDIDGVTQALDPSLNQQATMTLKGQMRATDQPAGAPRCQPEVTSDQRAGEVASSVTVSVTANCLDEVYDMQAVQVLAASKLTQDASSNPGPTYVPVGDILSTVVKSVPDNQGNVQLQVNAQGVWAYQFSAVQRARFASLIVGKSSQDAQTLLLQQPGVHSVTITLTGSGADSVPGDTKHITINVEAVPGLHS